ncbi:YgaP family membrane protein [Undibacterium sp. RuTC16W]|uniref:YgaP family membrane protein n=1 Tax=Undibacterium sp. RuTC16W TaxID=3413048 RepID=UPI003BEFF77C
MSSATIEKDDMMLYVKNVPGWERVLRILAGVIAIAASIYFFDGKLALMLALSAAGMVMSGLFGFCPMCAMVGRRLDRRDR